MTNKHETSDWSAGVIAGIEIGQHNAAVAASQQPAGEYPPLPMIEHWLNETYTAAQMREYVDADRKARAAAREQIIGSALYAAINEMMANLGRDGDIDTRHPAVEAVMSALHEIDGGAPRAQADAPSDEDIISLAITEALLYQSAFGDYECGYREDADTSSYVLSFARALLARYGRTQADADKRDAERWRHARDILTVDDIEFAQSVMGPHGTPDEDESKKVDDAIDAALARKGGAA